MKPPFAALFIFLAAGVASAGDDGYAFCVSVATVADGLRALDPVHPSLQAAPATRLAEPALLFEKRSQGDGWRVTFATCPKAQTPFGCEIRINKSSQSGAIRDSVLDPLKRQLFDLGFSRNHDGSLQARCLRKTCSIRIVSPAGEKSQLQMRFGESSTIPSGVEVDAAFNE